MPSLEEDIGAAYDAFGPEKLGLIWGVGQMSWKDAAERDRFLAEATKPVTPRG